MLNRERVVYDLREFASILHALDHDEIKDELEFFAYQITVGVYDA